MGRDSIYIKLWYNNYAKVLFFLTKYFNHLIYILDTINNEK